MTPGHSKFLPDGYEIGGFWDYLLGHSARYRRWRRGYWWFGHTGHWYRLKPEVEKPYGKTEDYGTQDAAPETR